MITTQGHPVAMVRRAVELREAEWSYRRIAELLNREFAPEQSVSPATVYRWAGRGVAEAHRQRERARMLNRTTGRLGSPHHTAEYRLQRASAFRALGLTPDMVAAVMAFDYGDDPIPAAPPPPMSKAEALGRAAELKRTGWSWTAVAQAMTEYHGQEPWSGDSWRSAVVYAGLDVPRREMSPARIAHLERLNAPRRPRGTA